MPRPVFLAGREDLLGSLDNVLREGAEPRVAVLHGLGGCGKTSAALEYAYRHLGGFGLVWQFAAEEPTTLAAGFGDLAAQLGGSGMTEAGNPVAQVHAMLAAYPGRWLLVFDNAPGLAAVESVLPPAGHGCVLVTSQDPAWPGRSRLEVPVLDRETAAVFLQSRTGDADLGAARKLAGELGGLPLALEQAAAYMEASGRNTTGYLELLRRDRPGLLARGEAAGHEQRMVGTWQLAFDQLSQDVPEAIALLRLLACCAPEQVPVRLLLRPGAAPGGLPAELVPLLDSPLAADDALAALRRYSLTGPLENGMVSVHRLVQSVTMDSLTAGQASAWREAARAIVSAALPSDPDMPADWSAYSVLVPHAEAALPPEDEGIIQVARYLAESGNYAAARDLCRRVVVARETALGARHPATLTARAELVHWTGWVESPAAARDELADLLPDLDRVLGPDHPGTLAHRARLARSTGVAGDPASARSQLDVLLPDLKRVLGPAHSDTLKARAELARWAAVRGDWPTAQDGLVGLLPDLKRVLGPAHPDSLRARSQLALVIGGAGDPASARDQLAGLLPDAQRALGSEHPFALNVRANLAHWTGEAGGQAAARDQLAGLLPDLERVIGSGHADIPVFRAWLARWTGEAGDWEAARDQLVGLLPELDRVLGLHPNALVARAELAHAIGETGDPVAARDRIATILPDLERVFYPEHPDILRFRAYLAHWARMATQGIVTPAGRPDDHSRQQSPISRRSRRPASRP